MAPGPTGNAFSVADSPALDELEHRYARHVLERLGGKRMEAAKALGVSYPTFLKLLLTLLTMPLPFHTPLLRPDLISPVMSV